MKANPVHPKKLLMSKWTAVNPLSREKHFMVVQVIEPKIEGAPIEKIVIEAVISRRQKTIHWRSLTNGSEWQRGWIC
jgi:tryptophan-rich hypothetical protein